MATKQDSEYRLYQTLLGRRWVVTKAKYDADGRPMRGRGKEIDITEDVNELMRQAGVQETDESEQYERPFPVRREGRLHARPKYGAFGSMARPTRSEFGAWRSAGPRLSGSSNASE